MKTILSLLAAVALVTSVGCKKSQTVEGPMDDPVSESAVATGGDLVEVIDIDPDLDDGYAHDVIEDVAPSSADRYEVRRGDTLWSIAERVSPDGRDIRHTVDRLSVVTGGSLLHPGQRIVIPYG